MSFLKKLFKVSKDKLFKALILVFFTGIVFVLVYFTGGTKTSWPQFNFIIILMAAYFFNTSTAVLLALFLGFLMGPIMPMDTDLNLSQCPTNWLIRTLMFMIVGFFSGSMLKRNKEVADKLVKKDTTDDLTGLLNKQKMLLSIDRLVSEGGDFYLAFLKILNLQEISMYVSDDIIKKIIDTFISTINKNFFYSEFFSSGDNEFTLLVKDDKIDVANIIESFNLVLENLKQVSVDHYTFNLIVKVGIRVYDDKKISANDLFNSARITSYQGERSSSSVSVFNLDFDQEMKFIHEIANSLAKAITDNEIFIVYQPIICLKTKKICGSEVLARWDRKKKTPVGPEVFVRVGEEIGLVPMITKSVISQHIDNYKDFKNNNIDITTHINITSEELKSIGLINWATYLTTAKNLEKYRLGFEITETTFHKDPEKINKSLKHLRSLGFKIAIDDFGTGYNSIKNLAEFEADTIKIDKYFVDRIDEEKIVNLLRSTIKAIHVIGLKVVAEGVESKDQLEILKAIGCDYIQGYYFSKPLSPQDFIKYYKDFHIDDYL